MSNEFDIGDLVRHQTGGPDMVVVGFDGNNKVMCEYWCHTNKSFFTRFFTKNAIKHKFKE
jgi:uncharacterized protein YodC (DUF2158 family)